MTGGDGGDMLGSGTDPTINAGTGGNVTVTATGIAKGSSAVTAVLSAQGGTGGQVIGGFVNNNDYSAGSGNGGTGGNATLTVTGSNNGAAPVSVVVSATGGTGGQAQGDGNNGNGGNAVATGYGYGGGTVTVASTATGGGGYTAFQPGGGVASADATGEVAQADATGMGASGTSTATATSFGGAITAVQALANAPVSGTSQVEARATVGNSAPDMSLASGMQAAGYATALPQAGDVANAVSGNPVAAARFSGSNALGLLAMEGGYVAGGGTGTLSFTSQITMTIGSGQVQGQTLYLGLVDPISTGNGFSTLEFKVSREQHDDS